MTAAAARALPPLIPAARASRVEVRVCKESRVNRIVYRINPAAQPSIATPHMRGPSKLFIHVIISFQRLRSDFLLACCRASSVSASKQNDAKSKHLEMYSTKSM